MLDKITFENYKLFKRKQTLELKPITVLIGKNSSGKTAVAKLLPLLEASLSGKYQDPIVMTHNNIEFGAEFRDLLYGRKRIGTLSLKLESGNEHLVVDIGAPEASKKQPFDNREYRRMCSYL